MLEELLKKIANALDAADIPYMIIGGQAVLVYGEPRFTQDIDITVGVGFDKLPDLIALAEQLSLKILPENPIEFVSKTMVLPLANKDTELRVDLIFSYTPYEREAINRANKIDIDGVKVNFASIEDLIIHKLFAGRPRDIEDIRGIVLKNKKIDMPYIRQWLTEFEATFPEGNFNKTLDEIIKNIS